MIKTRFEEKPLVYSCSGCSSTAQMTNYLAVQLDRKGIAEMSCIAGVGGHVKQLLRTARSGREIIVIDGCPLACSKACLLSQDIQPDLHFELSAFGVKKIYHADFDRHEADNILETLSAQIKNLQGLRNNNPLPPARVFRSEGLSFPWLGQTGVSIKEVYSKKQIREFIEFPNRLYKGNPFYVPQLTKDIRATFDKSRNPAYDFCEARYWLAYKNGKVAGRIAGIVNHAHKETWKQPYLRFGWIDFEEDKNIAYALLSQVENWAREKGLTAVHGPLGFTNFDNAGMLTAGFSEISTFATIYNYPYYPEFLEQLGYKKETGWVEYKIKISAMVPENLLKIASVVERRLGLRVVRATRKKEILAYAGRIFDLINSAYAGLFGVVPMTEKQVRYNTRKYLSFIKPELVSLVLDRNNELVGLGITMPSLSKALQKTGGKLFPLGFLHLLRAFQKNNTADLCLVAVRKDVQGKGVNAVLMREINEAFIRHGIQWAESNPELEENLKVQSQWNYYERVLHKRRSCFIKFL